MSMTERLGHEAVEDRTMPAVVYALYLMGIANGFTVLVGFVIALVCRGGAGWGARSHYTFLINTCWLWLVWMLIGGVLTLCGGLLSLLFVGLPFLFLGLAILGLTHLWFALRAIAGVIHLARDEPYPRPYSWLL